MRLTYPFSTSPGLRELYTTRKPPGGKGGQGVSDEEAEPGRYSGSGRYDVGHWLEDLDTFAGTWVAGWDGGQDGWRAGTIVFFLSTIFTFFSTPP